MSSGSAIVILLSATLALSGCDRKSPAPAQDNAALASPDEVTAAEAPMPKPGTIVRTHAGEPAPTVVFQAPGGGRTTLADFRGKPLLVNLWATWCAPCVAEMPTLDAAAAQAGDRLLVLAVSQDMDPAKADAFFAKAKFERLEPYRDPELGLSLAYGANLPTTILYDSKGIEVWRVAGGMDWTGAAARKLIAEAG